jgi:hypothetical protein
LPFAVKSEDDFPAGAEAFRVEEFARHRVVLLRDVPGQLTA